MAFPSGRCRAPLPPPNRLPASNRFATAAMSTPSLESLRRRGATASFIPRGGSSRRTASRLPAQITLWWYAVIGPGWHHHTFQDARPRVLATTGPDGTFEASFPKSVMANAYSTTQTQRPWSWAEIVAGADGYGPALSWAGGETNVYELKLVPDDVSVRGRVIDLQGQGVPGVSVWVQEMHDSQRITRSPSWKGLTTDLKTDKNGRFVLRGIGRDRSVTLHIGGPTVAHQMVEVSTQKVVAGKPIDHKDVEIVAGPSKPIHAVVRAADSGQPVPGVWIYGDEINDVNIRGIRAKSDAQGRFHLEAMPKSGSYMLSVYPRDDQPYVMTKVTVGDTQGLAPIETEIKLLRGALLRFRLIDKETGESRLGMARYVPYDDNPLFSDNVLLNQYFLRSATADEHGVYSLTVPTGAGIITVFIIDGSYVHARVREADRAKFPLIERQGSHAHMTLHNICHGYQMLDLKTGEEPAPFDIELDPGQKLTGTLVGPDGKPATGAVAYGLIGASTRDGKGVSIDRIAGSFSVTGLDPAREGPRPIVFLQKERGWAGRACAARRRAQSGPGATRPLGLRDWTVG